MDDGFCLIDAVEIPIPQGADSRERSEIVWSQRFNLIEWMKPLVTEDTKVILIKSPCGS
jgi:hypothetical protein